MGPFLAYPEIIDSVRLGVQQSSSVLEEVRSEAINGDRASSSDAFASPVQCEDAELPFCFGELTDAAPFPAAGAMSEPPSKVDDDNLLVDAPKARRFKKRGCRAGKAHNAAASCSSSMQDY